MEKTENERVVTTFGALTLTTKRILREQNGFWGGATEEIPLNKLDSIGYGYRRNLPLFAMGVILIVSGFVAMGVISLLPPIISIGLVAIGIILMIIGLLKGRFVMFRAGTTKILETGEEAEKFAHHVRSELHKKSYV